MPDIFISYAREDTAVAQALVSALVRSGYDVWWDRQIATGARYLDETETALRSARATVVLWSKTSIKSHWVADEAGLARDLGRLAPISIDGSMPPLGFGQFQVTDFSGWTGEEDGTFAHLLSALSRFNGHEQPLMSAQNDGPAFVPLLQAQPDFASIAVLPFTDMSAQGDQAYLGDGVAEEILNGLAKVRTLKVPGRTSSFSFRDRNATVEEIAAGLHVAHVLEGSVRKQGNKVRITAQLIQASDGFHVWSEAYDGDLTDIFDLQDSIARSIIGKLKILLNVDAGRIVSSMTSNPDAYEAFLQGRKLAQEQDGEGVLAEAIRHLEEAVRLDPQFALAWAWLANANFFLPEHNDTLDWKAHLTSGKKAAREAIRLAPDLSDASFAMSYARLLELDLLGQWEARRKAHEIDPSSVAAMHEYGMAYGLMGLFADALPYMEKSIANDPFSPSFTGALGVYQWTLGDEKAASASFDRSVELGFALVATTKTAMIAESGRPGEAHAYFMAAMKAHQEELPPGFRSRPVQWVLSCAIAKKATWAKRLIWMSIKGRVGNTEKYSDLSFKAMLVVLGEAEAYFSEVRNRPNTYLSGALLNLWTPLPGAQKIRTHPGFPKFAEDIGLVRCWQKLGWPPQIQPSPGTDGSNLQFTCS